MQDERYQSEPKDLETFLSGALDHDIAEGHTFFEIRGYVANVRSYCDDHHDKARYECDFLTSPNGKRKDSMKIVGPHGVAHRRAKFVKKHKPMLRFAYEQGLPIRIQGFVEKKQRERYTCNVTGLRIDSADYDAA